MLKLGISPSVPGATERPSLGEVVLRPLTAPSRLLSPRLGDLSARQASATAQVQVNVTPLRRRRRRPRWGGRSLPKRTSSLTCDRAVVLVEVDAHASALPPADAAASAPTQRDGHNAVHVGQHDGDADAWRRVGTLCQYAGMEEEKPEVCFLTGLTHADGCDDRGGDDGQGHAARDGEVPPVARGLLQLVVGVDLQWREQRGSLNRLSPHGARQTNNQAFIDTLKTHSSWL